MTHADERLEGELLEEFDDWTVEKGRGYFVRGAVRELVASEGALVALVKGTRPHPYCVTMPLDRASGLPDPLEGDCTCPVGSLCKHMAAALMAYARQRERPAALPQPVTPRVLPFVPRETAPAGKDEGTEPGGALTELARLLDRTGGSREALVPLAPVAGSPLSGWVSEFLREGPRTVFRGDRWRLVFTIGPAMLPAPGHQTGQRPTLRRPVLFPAVQYIMKSGEPGRVEKYKPERVTVLPDAPSAELLARVLGGGDRAPLLVHWNHLLEHPGIALFASDGEGRPLSRVAYRIRRIAELTIRMEPILERRGSGAEVSLRPSVRFRLEGEESAVSPAPRWVEAWDGRLIVSLGSEVLAWIDADPRYVELSRALIERPPHLSAAEAHALKRSFQADSPAGVSLDLPYRAVRLVSGTPGTRLVVSEDRWSHDIGVAVHFDYGEEGGTADGAYVLRVRNEELERKVVRILTELFRSTVETRPLAPREGSRASALIRLGTTVEGFLLSFGGELLSRGIDLCLDDPLAKIERASGPIRIMAESGIDWFGLKAVAGGEIDLRGLDPDDELFASGLIRSGGKLLYIGKEEAEKLKEVLALLDPDAPEARVAARDLDALSRLGEIVRERPPDLERLIKVARTLRSTASVPEAPVPPGLRATLRSYQRAGYSWLAFLADNGLNGCLADDMGLGKTVQALALLLRQKEASVPRPSLVVAPVSTLQNWRLEAARFAPALRVVVHHGLARAKEAGALERADLVVVSYATLRMDAGLLQSMEFDVVVLDEAQTIKNPTSQSFSAVKGLKGRHRFTLTGTPLENSVVDLWSQLDFLEPGLLGGLSRFRKDYASTRAGARVDRLRRVIRPFILRRTKDVVEASLPAKEEMILYAEMGARQAAAYEAIRKRYRLLIGGALKSKGIARSGTLIFEGLLRLRQAACFAAHADPSYAGVPSCKLEVLRDVLGEVLAEGHRVLVFSQFVQSLKEIQLALEARKTAYSYLDGSTRNRQAVIDDFQRDAGPPVFLLSLKAGGVGINLTAADYVVVFDPWWNPAVESQAVDRTHRIGQQKPVFVYRIVTRESIEEQVLELQERKRALARDLIDQDPRSLLSLSEEEILGFFDEK